MTCASPGATCRGCASSAPTRTKKWSPWSASPKTAMARPTAATAPLRPSPTSKPEPAKARAWGPKTEAPRCCQAGRAPRARGRPPRAWRECGSLGVLHGREREHEILLVERLVAGEAVFQVGLVVHGFVGLEGLVLPLAVAQLLGILAAPTGSLLHDRVADELALDEAAVGVPFRIAVGVEFGLVLHQREDAAARDRLPRLHCGDGFRCRIEFPVLLVVWAIDGGVEHALGVVLGKGDLFATGAHPDGQRHGGQAERGNDWQCFHGVSSPR